MPNELLENWREYQAQKQDFERRLSYVPPPANDDYEPGWMDRAPTGVVYERASA